MKVQTSKQSLETAHLELPLQKLKDFTEQRRILQRGRRGRMINSKRPFWVRAYRQKRFDNCRSHKILPTIKANCQLKLKVVSELCQVFPVLALTRNG